MRNKEYKGYTIVVDKAESMIINYFSDIMETNFHIACAHRNFTLGTEQYPSGKAMLQSILNTSCEDMDILKARLENSKDIVSLPLYLYNHSGITMNTVGFSCPWDSGQVGHIYISKEEIRELYGVKYVTEKVIKQVKHDMEIDIAGYDEYLRGEYDYEYDAKVYDKNGNLVLDTDYCAWNSDDLVQDVQRELDSLDSNFEYKGFGVSVFYAADKKYNCTVFNTDRAVAFQNFESSSKDEAIAGVKKGIDAIVSREFEEVENYLREV